VTSIDAAVNNLKLFPRGSSRAEQLLQERRRHGHKITKEL
jgi:hypothetical protein